MSDHRYRSRNTRKLYRNPDAAKICGVCAGIADYFEFEVWVVRIIAISLILFSGGPVVLIYFVLYFVLDPKPGSRSNPKCFVNIHAPSFKKKYKQKSDSNAGSSRYRSSVKDVWKSGGSPQDTLSNIEEMFSKAEKKLQRMESFVTSNQFELEKEFNKMKK